MDDPNDFTALSAQRIGLYSFAEGWAVTAKRADGAFTVRAERGGVVLESDAANLTLAEDMMLDTLEGLREAGAVPPGAISSSGSP